MYRNYEEYMRNVLNYRPINPITLTNTPNILYPNTYVPGYSNPSMGDIMQATYEQPYLQHNPINNNNQFFGRPPHLNKNMSSGTIPHNNLLKF